MRISKAILIFLPIALLAFLATGKINSDSLLDVAIDELYFNRIKVGLNASSEIDNKIHKLQIVRY